MLKFTDYPNAERVFFYFEEISKIPHGSFNTAPIADYLENFAKSHSLEYVRDTADNVVIKKNAFKGYENRPTVIMQGHTDMVAEKTQDSDKNLEKDGLELYRDGDFLRAKGTTLGGDDGIAVAYMLALLESDVIPHPTLEMVFTSNEEVGLLGADALDASVLSGKIMINVDSDDEGIFTVGCAGGGRVDFTLPVKRLASSGKCYELKVCELLGGHSGVEIDKCRANAIKLGAKILSSLGEIRIASLRGGTKDNAIPRDFTAVFTTAHGIGGVFEEAKSAALKAYKDIEPYAKVTLTECECDCDALDAASSKAVISVLNEIKSGVIAMSEDIKGLVESSENLGIASLLDESLEFTVSVRSSKSDKKAELIKNLKSIAEKYGAEVSVRGEYPAWEYRSESLVREVACKVFSSMYGRDAKVITIHAGLECGIFSDKIDGLDCISLGPDNYDIHTTEEHLSISSTARVWDFLKNVLKEI